MRFLASTVVVLHDLIHLQSEEFASPHYRLYAHILLHRISKKARKVITVSDFTKNEFVKRYPDGASKTKTIHNGLDHGLFHPPEREAIASFRKSHGLPEDFLLCVGIGKKHKNLDFVIRALAPLWREKRLRLPLVLGGTGGKIPDYAAIAVREGGVAEQVKPMPWLKTRELPLLYASATALVMPSLLEGFGFPVVEAMACAVPVLCSNASCLPEIAGTAAMLFDPRDARDFTAKLSVLVSEKSKRRELSEKGLQRAKDFSWERHVAELLSVYREVLQKK